MTNETARVEQAIRNAVETALPQIREIDFDAALTSDVGLDSVQVMDLVMEIEDELDISVPVEVLAEVQTLNQLAARLQPILEKTAR
ncbi:MAG: acyl carrier protein [Wenzhouxiangellaceae bacterium]